MQHVEDDEPAPPLGALASLGRVHARAYRAEVRAAVGVKADDLRVEHRGLAPEPPAGLGDELRERRAKVVAVTGAERRATTVMPELAAQPVPFDLGRPARTGGHAAAGREHRFQEARKRLQAGRRHTLATLRGART